MGAMTAIGCSLIASGPEESPRGRPPSMSGPRTSLRGASFGSGTGTTPRGSNNSPVGTDKLKRTPAREAVARLRRVAGTHRVTLVTATRDVEHSGATVLRDVLTGGARQHVCSPVQGKDHAT